ncbi:MAG: HAD-IIIC family phosphatase [Bryobacteraceae bacterium]
MKLIEALNILKGLPSDAPKQRRVLLACGFTPLHLETYLGAYLALQDPEAGIRITTGLYGDLAGTLQSLDPSTVDHVVALIEWSDLDPRLGIRNLGGWHPRNLADIVESVENACAGLERTLLKVSGVVPVAVSMPTLALPPLFATSTCQAGAVEMRVRAAVVMLAANLSQKGVRIVNPQRLEEESPLANRSNMKGELATGFPFSLPHASTLAALLAALMSDAAPKKGIITDLDDTLWAGILGDDGVQGISWHLEHHSHIHGLYQQFLASLAGAGVLLGVASKNTASVVDQAFERGDLLLTKDSIFPVEANWGPKSASVGRILAAWNVAADSVVFIDDSPLEVAEVQAAFPDMECSVFPKNDPQAVLDLMKSLRAQFGKPTLTDDDELRLRSIRAASEWREAAHSEAENTDEFLKNAQATIQFDCSRNAADARAFELVNKTNQFNLNGRRYSESEWRGFLGDPAAFLLTASYKDKFGALGKVAVLLGTVRTQTIHVSSWVMSCRAFSRRVEYQCLKHLFETFDGADIVFDYQSTARNQPLQELMTKLVGSESRLSAARFHSLAPDLYHQVEGQVHA